MLFFVFIALLIIGIIGVMKIDEWEYGVLHAFSCGITVAAGVAVVVSLVMITVCYTTIDAYIAENKQIYESLTYQYDNNVFDQDDDVIGKKELYNQIQDWNADLAWYQNIQDNFWFGIYFPNVFDQFEFIEYQ